MTKARGWPLSFAIGITLGSLLAATNAAGPNTPADPAIDADRRGIEKLHQQDVQATLSGDPQALADLFTDDAVLLEPGSAAVIGKNAILAGNRKQKTEHPAAKVITYKPEVQDLKVIDGWAFEWAYFDTSFKESEKGQVQGFRGKGLRVLRREPSGAWKFARVMWNLAPESGLSK